MSARPMPACVSCLHEEAAHALDGPCLAPNPYAEDEGDDEDTCACARYRPPWER